MGDKESVERLKERNDMRDCEVQREVASSNVVGGNTEWQIRKGKEVSNYEGKGEIGRDFRKTEGIGRGKREREKERKKKKIKLLQEKLF